MDVQLVDLDGVRGIDALANGERDLVTALHDDLRTVAGAVVLEVVVADRRGMRLGPRDARERRQDDGRRNHEEPPHAPNTISPPRSPAATKASIPNVARATSPTARRPANSRAVRLRRQR